MLLIAQVRGRGYVLGFVIVMMSCVTILKLPIFAVLVRTDVVSANTRLSSSPFPHLFSSLPILYIGQSSLLCQNCGRSHIFNHFFKRSVLEASHLAAVDAHMLSLKSGLISAVEAANLLN
jgi:hypothetical protein